MKGFKTQGGRSLAETMAHLAAKAEEGRRAGQQKQKGKKR